MNRRYESHAVAPTLVLHFLQRTFPFSELETSILEGLSKRCVIEHYPKGTVIFKQDATDVNYFHIVQKGGVKAYLTSEDTLVTLQDYSGEGESFGALSIVSGQRADFNVEAVEDTFCFLIDKEAFLTVVRENPRFGRYYMETFSEDFVCAVYSELRYGKVKNRKEDSLYLFNYRVRDVIKQIPDIVDDSLSVQQVGARMAELRADALLVRDRSGGVVGLVSTRDFRTKVVAQALAYDTPVQEIMASPLRTIPAQAPCFEALLRMIRERVDHLAVEHRRVVVGVVSARDILVHQGASFYYHFREIGVQRNMTGLYEVAQKTPVSVRTLLEEGARAENITKVITIFNDNITQRLLTLLVEEAGPLPLECCWLALGSEGRKEQTFRSDQDNAIIYEDPLEGSDPVDVRKYFKAFAFRAVDHLQDCGYPKCKNKFMASNPRWCQPYSVWEAYFEDWIGRAAPPDVHMFKIFFDFRPTWGKHALAEKLRDRVTDLASHHENFLRLLAQNCLSGPPPVSFFGDYIVEKDGRHSSGLDLKTRSLVPFVDFARIMALRFGIRETGTLGRLQALCDMGCIPKELHSDAREAYEFQIQLTLVRQLRMLEEGQGADSALKPSELSDLEKKTLKEAFAVIHRLMDQLRKEFMGTALASR